MAFDIGRFFDVDRDTYKEKGVTVYQFKDELVDEFVNDFLVPFRQAYISDEDLNNGIDNKVWKSKSEAVSEQIPTKANLKSGEFSEILMYFLCINFHCPDANVTPMKWRWKETQDMPCHLSDIVLLKCLDEYNPSEDDYMFLLESKGRAVVLSDGNRTSSMNAGIDGALKDRVSRAGKLVAYMRSKYNHDHLFSLARKVKRFSEPVDEDFIEYKKFFNAAIVVDRLSLDKHIDNIKPEKLKKAQEKEINLIAVPLCGMKRVYERMYEGILNIEDGAE